jgi:hypothetical protein
MNKLVLPAGVIGTLLAGVVAAFAASFPLEGSWSFTLVPNQFGIAIETTLKIENQTVTMINVCTFNGRTAEVSITVPAQYDDHTMRILSVAEKKIRQDGFDCSVTAEPEPVTYRVQGSALFLSKQGSTEELTLTRR